jgi:antitoxin CcdA
MKRAANLSVRGDLIEAARVERVNLSALLEWALEKELQRARWRHWRQENAQAIDAYNRHLQEYGAFAQRSW